MTEALVVGVRVRPFNQREIDLKAKLCIEMQDKSTKILDMDACSTGPKEATFGFDQSFWSHDGFEDDGTGYSRALPGSKYDDQQKVFETFGTRVLDNAWAGFHCCLFAYGQTGSGKSYSMVGYGKNKGIVPTSCEEIFTRIAKNDNPSKHYEVVVSLVEIYNECVQDLLILAEDRPKKGLDIRESKMLGIYIDGVQKRVVASYAAIEAVIEDATQNRTVGATLMNATSSRAHTVITIEFKQVEKMDGQDCTKVSKINLVDLAGSEKAGQTGAEGARLKEGAAINKSLSALGNVIEKLADKAAGKKVTLIPYRDSKLTRLLQNALGGSAKTIMICALSPASSNFEETLSTLRYADRAKKIKNSAVVNENPQEKLIRELREENIKYKELIKDVAPGDLASLSEKKKELEAAEAELRELQKSFEERMQQSASCQSMQEQRRDKSKFMRSLSQLGEDTSNPHITNLNEDLQLTGRIRHYMPEGSDLVVGRSSSGCISEDCSDADTESEDDVCLTDAGLDAAAESEPQRKPDVVVAGLGIFMNHATLTNVGGTCFLSATAKRSAHLTFVNGVSLKMLLGDGSQEQERSAERQDAARPSRPSVVSRGDLGRVQLCHGDRIAFGHKMTLFVFIGPGQSELDQLLDSGEVSFLKARKELVKHLWKDVEQKVGRVSRQDVEQKVGRASRVSFVSTVDVAEPEACCDSDEEVDAEGRKRGRTDSTCQSLFDMAAGGDAHGHMLLRRLNTLGVLPKQLQTDVYDLQMEMHATKMEELTLAHAETEAALHNNMELMQEQLESVQKERLTLQDSELHQCETKQRFKLELFAQKLSHASLVSSRDQGTLRLHATEASEAEALRSSHNLEAELAAEERACQAAEAELERARTEIVEEGRSHGDTRQRLSDAERSERQAASSLADTMQRLSDAERSERQATSSLAHERKCHEDAVRDLEALRAELERISRVHAQVEAHTLTSCLNHQAELAIERAACKRMEDEVQWARAQVREEGRCHGDTQQRLHEIQRSENQAVCDLAQERRRHEDAMKDLQALRAELDRIQAVRAQVEADAQTSSHAFRAELAREQAMCERMEDEIEQSRVKMLEEGRCHGDVKDRLTEAERSEKQAVLGLAAERQSREDAMQDLNALRAELDRIRVVHAQVESDALTSRARFLAELDKEQAVCRKMGDEIMEEGRRHGDTKQRLEEVERSENGAVAKLTKQNLDATLALRAQLALVEDETQRSLRTMEASHEEENRRLRQCEVDLDAAHRHAESKVQRAVAELDHCEGRSRDTEEELQKVRQALDDSQRSSCGSFFSSFWTRDYKSGVLQTFCVRKDNRSIEERTPPTPLDSRTVETNQHHHRRRDCVLCSGI